MKILFYTITVLSTVLNILKWRLTLTALSAPAQLLIQIYRPSLYQIHIFFSEKNSNAAILLALKLDGHKRNSSAFYSAVSCAESLASPTEAKLLSNFRRRDTDVRLASQSSTCINVAGKVALPTLTRQNTAPVQGP